MEEDDIPKVCAFSNPAYMLWLADYFSNRQKWPLPGTPNLYELLNKTTVIESSSFKATMLMLLSRHSAPTDPSQWHGDECAESNIDCARFHPNWL